MMKFWFEMTTKLCFIALCLFTKSSFCSELPPAETLTIGTELSTNVSSNGSVWSPEFIQDLLPSAERTALLYHLSYLCLGKFPKLERLIRQRAVETQLLFASSEDVLRNCVLTSRSLVQSLFPILVKAVEHNKPTLAVRYLSKANEWITDIIRKVEDLVKRYEEQNQNVASSASDVFQEKAETERIKQLQTQEMESLNRTLEGLKTELDANTKSRVNIENQFREKNLELQNLVEKASRKSNGLNILASLVPFVGAIIKSIVETATSPGEAAKIQALSADLTRLSGEKISLQNQEWSIKVKQMEYQLQLSKSSIELGMIPDPVHLTNVQQCLTRIRDILFQLLRFWQEVKSLLENLKKETFVGDELIEYLDILKDEFLATIETAGKYWTNFGQSCQSVQGTFSTQSKDAYRFLESNPSALSKEAWESEYKSIVEKLNKITPLQPTMAAATMRPMIQ